MDQKKFIINFAAQFYETDSEIFSLETNFEEIAEWSSLTALSVLAMVEEEYRVLLTGDEIRNSHTIKDLYNVVKFKFNKNNC